MPRDISFFWRTFLILTVCLAGCAYPRPPAAWPPCANPVFDTQGHRGARAYRPENTLPAMQYAIEKGVKTLEMDVSVTKDNVLVLSHDPHLLPGICLSPDGLPAPEVAIRSLTLKQLKEFDCGSLRNPRFPQQVTVPGTPPPTLMDVFDLAEALSNGMIRYNIETKIAPDWDPTLTPSPEEFAALIDQAVNAAGVANRTIIQSFDSRTLVALRKRGSRVKTALLVGANRKDVDKEKRFEEALGEAQRIDAEILSPEWHLVTSALVEKAHAMGISVIPWTVNNRESMHQVISANVDGLISDDVDLMMAVVQEEVRPGQGVCLDDFMAH